MQVKYTKI
jgi:hypothetical protein